MPGELGRRALDALLEQRRGVRRVQPHALAWQEVVVDRLGEQGVPEGEGVLADPSKDVLLDSVAQRPVEHLVVEGDHTSKQLVRHPPARRGRRPDHLTCGVVEPVEPHEQQVGEVLRQTEAARPLGGTHQLLGEERVALGAGDDRLHLGVRERTLQR